MLAKLIVEGKEFDIEILDPKLQELITPAKKKTGYESVNVSETYFWDDSVMVHGVGGGHEVDEELYDVANYYSSETVAKNNARADKLMRQMRRFAVEHRENELDWNNVDQTKLSIYYDYESRQIEIIDDYDCRTLFSIFFDSAEAAHLAIETFKDELIWYFTEYKDSP